MNKQVICEVDEQYFGFDSLCVRSIENLKAEMILGKAPDYVEGILKFRGEWVPIINIRKLLRMERSPEPSLNQVIFMNTVNGCFGFRVDHVIEIEDINEGDVQKVPIVMNSDTEYMRGACSHNNRLIVIIDHDKIIDKEGLDRIRKSLKAVYDAEAEEKRRKAEEEAKKQAEEEAKKQAEEEAKKKAEEEAKKKAEEEAKKKAEEEAKKKAEEEAKKKAEEEAKKKAEEEAKKKAEEEAKKKAEEEAKKKAEEEAKKKAEEEAKKKAEEEAKKKAEEETGKTSEEEQKGSQESIDGEKNENKNIKKSSQKKNSGATKGKKKKVKE